MSFTLINQYIIVIQMISHDSIKYSYCTGWQFSCGPFMSLL